MKQYKVADVFSGCGGFTAGFQDKSKYRTEYAVDSWNVALDTLKANFPHVTCLDTDLSISGAVERLARTLAGTDVMLGGPPCQGFSTLGKRRDGDHRSTLVDVFADLVAKVQPRIVLVENVRGIMTKRHPEHGTFANALIKKLQEPAAGAYICTAKLLNAADFGIPQSRIRWFMVAVRGDIASPQVLDKFWHFVEQRKSSDHANVQNAFADLPRLNAGEESKWLPDGSPLYNHRAMRHSTELVRRLAHIPPGGGLLDVPKDLLTGHLRKMVEGGYGSGGHVKNIYGRLDWDHPSGTVVAGIDKITCGRFVHPEQSRLITPREAARLQSFNDEFEFLGGQVAQYYQIGNAVPPVLAKMLADGVLTILKELSMNANSVKGAALTRELAS